jgi:LytS/YehU family sensor histidine kinase
MFSENLLIGILSATLVILLLIISIVVVIILARRQSMKQQLNEAVYKNKLNDITSASLKAQMNPHFIFNCLNSIKLYTEQNDSDAASMYLGKFSKLIRNMLDNARSEKTMLVSEIETLRLYLEMETMRFKDKMTYEIILDKDLDTDFIEIPPLLIQPYVENAIWHGIMHKIGRGKVSIAIRDMDEKGLIITIEDDGIGRTKAATFKNDNSQHRSHGIQITNDRIALFNERYKSDASVVITDIYDNESRPSGTLVTINLSKV